MLFNSLDFAAFLPLVFALYWLIPRENIKLQNLLLLAASYVFYGWWEWKFLTLILISTAVDYAIGLALAKETQTPRRKILLWTSILVNLGILGFFKYYNFFLDNFVTAFSFLGYDIPANSLNIILPVGISFYTFQSMSYSIDVYRRRLEPTSDFIAFSAYVSFFPQLVAGPIERAKQLLPQFYVPRKLSYDQAADGIRQILWGLFKKIVIADNCAVLANTIFENSADHSGSTLILGLIFFHFQIYCDFSGYSDIAIGTARLFGFNLMKNFAFPYFSRDIAEYWRRWHISLSSWFKDYLYIPLGGSRGGMWMKLRNTFIIFVVSGFWHGASWNYVIWGALNALYIMPLILMNTNRNNIEIVAKGKYLPSFKEFLQIGLTTALVLFSWIFFRGENMTHSLAYMMEVFSMSTFSVPEFFGKKVFILIIIMMLIEWWGRENEYAIESMANIQSTFIRYAIYYVLIMTIILYGAETEQTFIYFQF